MSIHYGHQSWVRMTMAFGVANRIEGDGTSYWSNKIDPQASLRCESMKLLACGGWLERCLACADVPNRQTRQRKQFL